MSGFISRACLTLAAILIASACGDDTATPTQPTTPTTVTKTFTGTLGRNAAMTHDFTTQRSGTVTATLTSLTPDPTAIIGLSLGTWNGTVCQIVLANDKGTQGSSVAGTVSTFGNLCVRVYDVGALTQVVSYEVQVVHP